MLRSDRLTSILYGGVGFRQPTIKDYAILDTDNLTSRSGLYFDDASSFVTIQNIKDCQSDSQISVSEFNAYLKNLVKSVILDICQRITFGKADLIHVNNLYPFEKKFDETLEPIGNKFVGFKIEPQTVNSDMIGKVSFLELAFDNDITIDIHLFNSNVKTPIKTKECVCIGGQSNIFSVDDWFLGDSDTFKGGNFYIGYFESDLGAIKPIKRDWERSTVQIKTAFYHVEPVFMNVVDTWFDVDSDEVEDDTFGLNIGINVYNDYTELLIRNDNLIYPAIKYGMAEKVLSLVKSSVRSNLIERLNKENIDEINFELYGNSALGITGVNGKLNEQVENVKKMIFFTPLLTVNTLK